MNVTKITIGRLFNLGSYEHVRYELTVEIREEAQNVARRKSSERRETRLGNGWRL